MVKLVQLGLGVWGRSWVQEVTSQVSGIEPVAWIDRDAQVRALAIAELGLPRDRVFASVEQVPAQLAAQAALIVVPLAAHAAAARTDLEQGLHVLVEKPFTEALGEA
ncbi:Gfo/Idh/MocA family oxidoreductase, partial [Methyloceanibacter sp.]|uniref:Gfo/Idh/MocA family oxidoreductase n=1 Tax=Methyloceanibacter sp. TaxID=1965321 RepID=UPI00351B82F4